MKYFLFFLSLLAISCKTQDIAQTTNSCFTTLEASIKTATGAYWECEVTGGSTIKSGYGFNEDKSLCTFQINQDGTTSYYACTSTWEPVDCKEIVAKNKNGQQYLDIKNIANVIPKTTMNFDGLLTGETTATTFSCIYKAN